MTSVLFAAASPLSAIPCVGSIGLFKTYRAFAWDVVLFIAWIVTFGIFAGIFSQRHSDDKYKGSSTGAMKAAVWFDFVNAILWLVTGIYGAFKTWGGKKVDGLPEKVRGKALEKWRARKKDHPYNTV